MHQKYQEINALYPFIDDSIDGNKCNDTINREEHDNTSCVALLTP